MTLVLTGGLVPLSSVDAAASGAATLTTSHYEASASTDALNSQGQTAGRSGMQGLVVLDFGRPASDGTNDGTIDFSHGFVSFANITAGVESYVMGYYDAAPAATTLDIAVGTNDSCGVSQPCGSIVCGCPDEPSSYIPGARSSPTRWSSSMRGRRMSRHRTGSPTRSTSGLATTPSLRSTRDSTTPSM
jgi:hypothetical protein